MQKIDILVKKDGLGFIPTTDDSEESYRKRVGLSEKFYHHFNLLTKHNSKELEFYFEGNLDSIEFIENSDDACRIVHNYFAYYPKRFSIIEFDSANVKPKIFKNHLENIVAPLDNIKETNAFISSVPYRGQWHDIIYLPKKEMPEFKRDCVLAHELVHACTLPTLVNKKDFFAEDNPHGLSDFSQTEIYPFIVGMNYLIIKNIVKNKKLDKSVKQRLSKAIANNAHESEIKKIVECKEIGEYTLENFCKKLPETLNASYNSNNIFKSSFGTGWMYFGAAFFNPFAWWYGAFQAMSANQDLFRSWSNMKGIVNHFFSARRKLKEIYGNKSAKKIVGRVTIGELENLGEMGKEEIKEWINSKKNFKWDLIKRVARI